MRSTGSWYDVRDFETGHIWQCRLKGRFKSLGLKVTNPIAVGDHVGYEIEGGDENFGIIDEIYPRENYVIRSSVHKTAHGHLNRGERGSGDFDSYTCFSKNLIGFY